ncbi:MAG: NAD(P)H-quinone oxidoreductase [Myxococcales bacterium]
MTGAGGPEVLVERELPEPVPGPDEVVVRVRAAGINRADLLQRRGLYPAPPDAPADIPGLEFAGEVEACGARVRRFGGGERVMGIVGGGGYAERLVVHERAAVPIPAGLDFARAAAIPEAFFTGFDALLLQARVTPGESVLIHAVGSGVGTAAVQLCRLVGAQALGTARTAGKLERARALGLADGLVCAEPAFAAWTRQQTGGRGADVVLDLVGGAYARENAAALAERGRWLLVGLMAGASAEVPLGTLLTRRLTLIGTALRTRPLEEKLAVAQAFEKQLLPQFARGALEPVLEAVLPMTQAAEAHRRMEANLTFGKLVLAW